MHGHLEQMKLIVLLVRQMPTSNGTDSTLGSLSCLNYHQLNNASADIITGYTAPYPYSTDISHAAGIFHIDDVYDNSYGGADSQLGSFAVTIKTIIIFGEIL